MLAPDMDHSLILERNHSPVSNAPAYNTPGVALGSNVDGKNLGRVEPGDGKPGGPEDEGVQEDHRSRSSTPLVRSIDISTFSGIEASTGQATDEEHRNSLANGAPVEGPASADSVDGEDTDQSCKHVEDVVETRHPLRFIRFEAGNVENSWNGDRISFVTALDGVGICLLGPYMVIPAMPVQH